MSEELKPVITNDPVPVRNNLVVERVICPSCGVGEMKVIMRKLIKHTIYDPDKNTYIPVNHHECTNCGHREEYSNAYPRIGFIAKSGEFQEVKV